MQRAYTLEESRRRSRPTKAMREAVLEARKEKIRNKTREKERARRGYWNSNTLRQMRQGPPAHIMVKMSPEKLHQDKVSRSPSQVGYVARVKRSMGMKLTRPPPWNPEAGKPDLRIELDQLENQIRKVNTGKRTTEDDSSK
jgi:hypothetical protein